jgi:ribonucleoside-diphosphate reductase alpha chain
MQNPDSTTTATTVADRNLAQNKFSNNAEAVLRARYLRKDESGQPVELPDDLFQRVAETIANAEKHYGYSGIEIAAIAEQFRYLMASGTFLPNSPTLMNAGRPCGLLSACFVLPVEDSIEGIFFAIRNTAVIQKAGGGTGFSFSRLRPRGDRVASSGGTTSGPISFIKVFGEATNAIQQGAFRRGANMGVMRIDHPDIIEFINAKQDLAQLTNFNLSVGITDEFMKTLHGAPQREHRICNPRNHHESLITRPDGSHWTTGDVFELIVQRAWESGEPGIVFIDRMNQANPTPFLGPIEATNPCGEQPLLPYESCTLGSVNLMAFVSATDSGKAFDFPKFKDVIHLAVRFLDDVIDANTYPIPEIDSITKGNRKIGLGVMGLADCLFALNIPYASEQGIQFGASIMEFLQTESHQASQELARRRGPFPYCAKSVWGHQGIQMRNACTTCVAPTGSISIIAGCSSGIEPVFSLAFYRNVLNGQHLAEVNLQFESVAKKHGIFNEALVSELAETGTIQNLHRIPEDMRRVFVTAHDIAPEWHVRMQAAFQKHCDAAISKTINMPTCATVAEVRNAYLLAYELGCKGVTVYRDGCRKNQPQALTRITKSDAPITAVAEPMALPSIMPALRIRQQTPFGNMHVKIVVDPQTKLEREIFAQLGKGGDLANSDLEAICRVSSLFLRIGGTLDDLLSQLSGIGSSISIPTKEGRITSLADGLAQAIEKYRHARDIHGLEAVLLGKADANPEQLQLAGIATKPSDAYQGFKIKCPQPECSAYLTFQEGCAKCVACGFSLC